MPIVVYKLGGSLLTLPDLRERLIPILSRAMEHPLLIVGGGEAADIVRRWDEQFEIGEERAHWLALRAMAFNEQLVQSILSGSRIVTSLDEARLAWEMAEIPILCAHDFLACEENTALEVRCVPPLPHVWSVTSDSIAAWVAIKFAASALVLLKSCDPSPASNANAADSTDVDPYFRNLALHPLAIEWVNLRTGVPRRVRWTVPIAAQSSD
ncbi:MAG: hypothetical protein AB7O26_14085 [Planctomycetaceae bacterium]